MTSIQIKQELLKRGYTMEELKCKGMYDIYFKKTKVAYLFNSPSKGYATIQIIGDMTPIQVNCPNDFWWYLV